jgi:hypothetical protein
MNANVPQRRVAPGHVFQPYRDLGVDDAGRHRRGTGVPSLPMRDSCPKVEDNSA